MSDAERYGASLDDEYEQQLQAEARKPRCLPPKRLCTPHRIPKPSGVRLCHGADCPDKPNAVIDAHEYLGVGRRSPTPWRGQ